MANISNILKCTTQLADGNNVGTDQTVTSGKNEFVSESIPSNQTDLPLAFAFTNSKLKGFSAHATVDMTVYTNDVHDGSPQEKLNLKAGITYQWNLTGSYIGSGAAASPFAGNVTSVFVTNTTTGVLTLSAIVDPT